MNDILGPPTPPVNTPGLLKMTAEGGGYVITCVCRWLRWFPTKGDASEGEQAHAKKCKGAPVKNEAAPTRARGKSDWNGREGSTWIDQL